MPGSHRPGRYGLHQARSAERCLGECHEGVKRILVITACEADSKMGGSFDEFIQRLVWALPETAIKGSMELSLGCFTIYTNYVIRAFPLVRSIGYSRRAD